MISKELLSLVLDKEITQVRDAECNNELVFFQGASEDTVTFETLNLDTLGRLCKEWCFSKSYKLLPLGAWRHDSKIDHSCLAKHFSVSLSEAVNVCENDRFYADTEVEAIIKATEWVAKKKGLLDD